MTTQQKPKGVKCTTPTGRASYPAIFTPKKKYYPPGTEPANPDYEYSIEILFPKGTDLTAFNKSIDEAIAQVYGNDKKRWPTNISRPLTDQEILIDKAAEKGQSTDHLEAGAFFARFKTSAKNTKPIVVDQGEGGKLQEIIDPTAIYGGCYVKASSQIKVWEIKGKDPVTKKPISNVYVTCYLQGVQKVKDGESFGGRPSVSEMFEPIVMDEEITADDILG